MIEVINLRKEYNNFVAVNNINFNIKKGEIVGIVGPNGAGKTTTLKMLSGLIKPTNGEIYIDGLNYSKDAIKIKSMLGFLPEESPLYENMTVLDYLKFFAEIFGVNKNLAEERIKNLLTALNLNPKKIGDLSKGMKRKVAIARSLINDPQILIYDEPTSGLDPMTSKYITDFIHSLKKNKTIVFSAHNLYQVESISDRVLILKEGSIIAEGTMDEIRKKYGSTEYQVEFQADGVSVPWAEPYNGHYLVKTRDLDKVNYITKLISNNKGNLIGVRTKEASLEDIFLKLIIQN